MNNKQMARIFSPFHFLSSALIILKIAAFAALISISNSVS